MEYDRTTLTRMPGGSVSLPGVCPRCKRSNQGLGGQPVRDQKNIVVALTGGWWPYTHTALAAPDRSLFGCGGCGHVVEVLHE